VEVTTPPTPINDAHPGGLLFLRRNVQFDKPHLEIPAQLELLKQRGLIVQDETVARHYLEHLNYYRLSDYWIPYIKDSQTHQFHGGTTFEHILNLYIFDRELRLLILDAIERIEVSIRSKWAYHLGKIHGSHAHLNPTLFVNNKKWVHTDAVAKLEKEVGKSREDSIVHFRQTYDESLPPLWALVEIMTIGELSHWFGNLKYRQDRNAVARTYDMDETNIASFLHHLTLIRNKCAHHSRLWNRDFTFTLKLPHNRPAVVVSSVNKNATRKIYNTLVLMIYLLDIISPEHHWRKRFLSLATQHTIDLQQMGFPVDYQNLPLWK
jgi:abortive infection bacteriophage resistance protein